MFRRTVAAIVSLVIVLSITAGCGTSVPPNVQPPAAAPQVSAPAAEAPANEGAASSGGKISYYIHSSILPQVHIDFIEKAGLKDSVDVVELPYNQYENTMRTKIAGNDIPDVFAVDGPNIASYASMDAMEALDAFWDPEDYKDLLDVSQLAMKYDGKIYAAPLCESNTLLFYNKEMLSAAGIEPATNLDNAWTLDQLVENAKKLTQKDSAGNVTVYGLMPAMFTPNNTSEGMPYTQQPWLWSMGGDLISPDLTTTKGYIDSEATKKTLQLWYDLHNTWGVSPAIEMTSPFEAEKVALWYQTAHIVGAWKNNMPEWYQSGKWAAMPAPRLDAGIVTSNGSWNLAMGKNSSNKELAWELITLMTGAEHSGDFVQQWGRLPARKSVIESLDIYDENPWDVVKMQMVDTNTARMRYVTPIYPQISEIYVELFNSVAFGENVDAALAQAGNKLEQVIARQ